MEVTEQRRAVVERAVERWRQQLLDLTGRNQLLYYRTLKKGTLDLAKASSDALERLKSGQSVRLSQLFVQPADLADASSRARTIHRRTRTHIEEKGIATLFLADTFASWTTSSSSATPNAPVLLAHLQLRPRGVAAEDFDLVLEGEWTVNDAWLSLIDSEFDVRLTSSELTNGGDAEPLELVRRVRKACAEIPGFALTDRATIGNFAYQKMPMVLDLEQSLDALAEHDLIAAISGDAGAREEYLAGQPDLPSVDAPDSTAPANEFLILDADSSQNIAINLALGGGSLVVQGPPGTGKSQTIANLIAGLAAHGRTVLFVAEKRAAIEAVTRRLADTNLSELVLDLHQGTVSKRDFAKQLAASLQTASAIPEIDESQTHEQLEQSRDRLAEHVRRMHDVRPPFEVSVFDAQARALKLKDAGYDTTLRWRGSKLSRLTGAVRRQMREALSEWAQLTERLRGPNSSVWSDGNVPTKQEADRAEQLLDRLLNNLLPSAVSAASEWVGDLETRTVDRYATLVMAHRAVRATDQHLQRDVFDLDTAALTEQLSPIARGLFARIGAALSEAEYRDAKKTIRGLHVAERRPKAAEILQAAQTAHEATRQWLQAALEHGPQAAPQNDQHAALFEHLGTDLARLSALVGRDLTHGLTLADLQSHVRELFDDRATLRKLPRIHQIEQIAKQAGLEPLFAAVGQDGVEAGDLADIFDLAWHQSVLDHLGATDEHLEAFDGRVHDEVVERFVEADRTHRNTTSARIRRRVAEHLIAAMDAEREQGDLVRSEANKKRAHKPIRDLIEATPDVLLGVRPCWAMSPLIVSQLLPARQLFDVVIFDEASQVLPADAVPALLRAKQAIVAGDEHQLPPTTFFDGGANEGEDDEDDGDAPALTEGFEAILDVLKSILPERWLSWHYRSADERLIAFSNRHVYKDSLTTFPGKGGYPPLRSVIVGSTERDTRSNPAEVNRVVDLAIEFARAHPEQSLGVIALGQHHASRIDDALRQRLVDEPTELQAFFADESTERPFVKNIERVQGDERDHIILTTGYDAWTDGRLLNRLGPLNHDVGYRRLNVAVSRARRSLILVSSFRAEDMTPQRFSSRGASMLRDYLRYVDSGGSELQEADHDALNPFEMSILQRLRDQGLEVLPQWGVSGFKIDFAIRHPQDPERFVLAVEADGASYHSSPTARDRDRLRQQVLESKGWRFHRIWSTDYFRDPTTEIERVVAAVAAAVESGDLAPSTEDDPNKIEAWEYEAPERGPRPHLPASGTPIDRYTQAQLRRLVQWVRSDTRLRTEAELLDEVVRELGFRRKGRKIVEAVSAAIRDTA